MLGLVLDGTVNVIGEGGPRRGVSTSIGPKLHSWSRFRRNMYMNTGGPEFSVDKIGFWNS
jgi:hypothetical protein